MNEAQEQNENRARYELEALVEVVDAHLQKCLPSRDLPPKELMEAMAYSLLAPGKRMRPALVLLCAALVRTEEQTWSSAELDAAAAVEMVHAFSLVHDDLPAIDNDDLRRGRPTSHVVFGEAVAILAGDALFGLAFETLANLECEPVVAIGAIRELTEAVGTQGLVAGETMDILAEGQPTSMESLQRIHAMKTGALLRAACAIGGMIGGGSEAEVAALREYGAAIGLAFQIADDLLNATSTAEKLGKAAGSDAERGKATYPALIGIEASKAAAKAAVDRAITALGHWQSTDASAHQRELAARLEALARYSIERQL